MTTDSASTISRTVRVGVVGLGSWATYAHIPALRALPDHEVVAVSRRDAESARHTAESLGLPHTVVGHEALVTHPDVDLVLVPTPAPTHAPLVRAAIEAGKDVYAEWPLTTSTTESRELLDLAERAGVRHVVGLQRRLSPSTRFAGDLVRDGYVGDVRTVRFSIGTDDYGPRRPASRAWTVDPSAYTHLLAIYGGRFLDLLTQVVGPLGDLTTSGRTRFDEITIDDGRTLASINLDELLVQGALADGGLVQARIEGGQAVPTGLQIEVTGTHGVLRVGNEQAVAGADNVVVGATAGSEPAVLPVPAGYRSFDALDLPQVVRDVAALHAAGTDAPTFEDAVRLHELLDRIAESAAR